LDFDNALGEDCNIVLQDAKAGVLLNRKESWPKPGKLYLDGFAFSTLDSLASREAAVQREWLRRQFNAASTQPYEQLAAVLRTIGLDDQARQVMIAKNEEQGKQSLGPQGIIWYKFFGPLIGFGYLPWNAFYASLGVIMLGYLLFRAGKLCEVVTPTKNDAYVGSDATTQQLAEFYPRFNAFIYSLETFVPLLHLNMSDYWTPNPNRARTVRLEDLFIVTPLEARLPRKAAVWLQKSLSKFAILKRDVPIDGRALRIYLWFHIIAGWVLTTLWVGGLAGLIKT
jgi:hypothetical protein